MGDLLQLLVDGENEVLAAHARRRAKLADDAPVGIDLIADGAGFAPELGVQTFSSRLAGAKSGTRITGCAPTSSLSAKPT